MIVVTGHDVNEARRRLGRMWGLGGDLTEGQLARALEMHPRNDSRSYNELGARVCKEPTGPQRVAIQAMLEGFVPQGAPSCAKR